ncbi:MAG TPA: 50S ribosomal protein L6 [Candidatus Pacearchaeota archaeon]|nr:50S ribosomal protein L6 [archaeon BMS3Abin17]HDK42263.1 50S ribosomal protein L6 [Candidatus Pacearchaeota archaeon]HDZ60407.1 50S ribosomal protein L6 [Candidatus Pacearchaeota archaeon]
MKKELFQEIEIPEGIEANIEETEITIKGPEGENKRRFNLHKLVFEKKDNKIIIGSKKATKNEKKIMNTVKAHIENMIKGVQKKFEYKLKICFSHFPFNVKIDGRDVIIKNFLGEKVDRKLKTPEDVEIKMDKEIISILSTDKELAGQTAADLEKITKIRMRDKRIFQDGIYIINKAGKEI